MAAAARAARGGRPTPGPTPGPVLGAAPVERSGGGLPDIGLVALETDGRVLAGLGPLRRGAYPAAAAALVAAAAADPAQLAAAGQAVEAAHVALMATLGGDAPLGFRGPRLRAGDGPRLGDGAALAAALGRVVVWGFSGADRQMGGQGGPMGAFFLHALARALDPGGPVLFLGLGRRLRLCRVDPAVPLPDIPGACLALDAGHGPRMPEAAPGRIDEALIAAHLAHPWFRLRPPRSLLVPGAPPDPDAALAALAPGDAAATGLALAAQAVASAADLLPDGPPALVLATGPLRGAAPLLAALSAGLGRSVQPVEALDLDGDALAPAAAAYLAARVLAGLPTSAPGTTGAAAAIGGAEVSRPVD